MIRCGKELIRGAMLAHVLLAYVPAAAADVLKIYIDADYSISTHTAQAIESGVRAALTEANYEAGGQEIEVTPFDHRGNARRSLRTMERYLEDDALALIGGMHSPPYLTHRDFINENGILTLLPWSAAGSITRPDEGQENWIFRLSIDDWKSAEFFWKLTKEQGQCDRVGLIIMDSGWGRDGFVRLSKAFADNDDEPVHFGFFTSPATDATVENLLSEFIQAEADCAILMSTQSDGAKIVDGLARAAPDVRIFSHWGVLGGAFTDAVAPGVLNSVDFQVINTCSLGGEAAGNDIIEKAIGYAGLQYSSLGEIPGSPGFAHAYDLTKILISAVEQAATTADWSGGIQARRRAVKSALQNLDEEVWGIVGRYERPFEEWTSGNPDAHEALGLGNLCASSFDAKGNLVHR